MIANFFLSLFFTICIELIVLFLFDTFYNHKKEEYFSTKNIIFGGIIASSLTLPYLHFIFLEIFPFTILSITLGECLVVIIEAFFYASFFKITFAKSFFLSFIANVSSFVFGILLLG